MNHTGKVISPTGIVHKVSFYWAVNGSRNEILCNHQNNKFIDNNQYPDTDKEITCKVCLMLSGETKRKIKSYSYLQYIWHDPNCGAWNRDPETNKEFPHLIKRFGIQQCTCGFDDDYKRLQKFIKGEI